jgi:predicted LPLAT superfamily acyltransferase
MQRFEEEIRPSRANRHEAYANYAQKFAKALEAQVIRAPLQWFNFYDFWETPVEISSAPLPSSPK